MGLIMLILIGTVPTAVCVLNHAVHIWRFADFISASSDQAGRILDSHVDKTGILGRSDAHRGDRLSIYTKELQPDTILALRELVEDLSHEVALYKEFKAVPAQDWRQRSP